ncbi:MAG TPA: bifunctional serine/threonine-protein kinase/formylglycine-generating enzyme family protein [Terriglobia bacterium]|nr:bifunctional serine/threonine-protein kinase/formylglycine-generating enzyme family protein [Terriglobia bacterium]
MKICPNCQQSYSDGLEFCPHDGARLATQAAQAEVDLAAGLSRHFSIVRRLGVGGMGTVFLAKQIGVGNRLVALKVLNRKLLDDPEFLERFQNEAGSTGSIHHPNVVTIHESGQADDGTPYIAMEFLEGESLRQVLKTVGALPVAECAEILMQVARGLNAAHKLGIIHRDLKPDNIFLTRGDEGELIVKIVDFGIAKLRESSTHTLTGMVLGTPAYMSAEQAAGIPSDELDARSDVYSLGIAVYEMLSGRVPFYSTTPLGYVHKHMLEAPPPFLAVDPGLFVAPEVEAAVMKALKKEREERYQSAMEFARAFAAAAQAAPTAEVRQPLPSAKIVPPTAAREPVVPTPLPASASAQADIAVQTPPPIPPTRIAEAASAPPPGSNSATAASLPPAVAKPPHLPAVKESSSPVKYVVLGVVLLAVITGGIWYFSRRAVSPPPPTVPSQTSDAGKSPPATEGTMAPAGMVSIPAATFTMGRDTTSDPEETPAHPVSVTAFELDKRPVTNARYAEFVKSTTHAAPKGWVNGTAPDGQAEWPVTDVSWDDANAYCTSKGLRLPTEAEWEYAARGTDGRLYPWGNDFSPALTNSAEAALGHPEEVGAHRDATSPFGLLDMSGNVWEWTADDYKPYPSRQPSFQIPADAKTIRGGSYQSDKLHVTTTIRNLDHASTRSATIGFRCAK